MGGEALTETGSGDPVAGDLVAAFDRGWPGG